jgi:hypothetical protein
MRISDYEAEKSEDQKIALRYMSIDSRVVDLLNKDDYVFYIETIRKGVQSNEEKALKWKDDKITSLEQEIMSKELTIRALQRETEMLWRSSVDKIVAEKMKVRELEENYKAVLGK